MDRRNFMVTGIVAAAAALSMSKDSLLAQPQNTSGKDKFKLRYAPSFGQFKEHAGNDLIDQAVGADPNQHRKNGRHTEQFDLFHLLARLPSKEVTPPLVWHVSSLPVRRSTPWSAPRAGHQR